MRISSRLLLSVLCLARFGLAQGQGSADINYARIIPEQLGTWNSMAYDEERKLNHTDPQEYFRATRGREVYVHVDVDPRSCSYIGNPAFSSYDRDKMSITVCMLSVIAIAQTMHGIRHLGQEGGPNAFDVLVAYEVGRNSQIFAGLALRDGSMAPKGNCWGYIAAFLISSGRLPTECDTDEFADRIAARTWAVRHLRLSAPNSASIAPGSQEELVVLRADWDTMLRTVLRFAIAHEIGHLLPAPKQSGAHSTAFLVEVQADAFATKFEPDVTQLLQLPYVLAAFWDQTRLSKRAGAPFSEHIEGRAASLIAAGYCSDIAIAKATILAVGDVSKFERLPAFTYSHILMCEKMKERFPQPTIN